MKKLFILFLFFAALSCFAAERVVVTFTDGIVDIRDLEGEQFEAFIGDEVLSGESVITGRESFAELEQEGGCLYKISPDTVFSVREMSLKGEKRSVLSCALGEVAFKFQRVTGGEPLISTGSVVAGIRGTEFTVYAGSDGSSLIAVKGGEVEVESEGRKVQLVSDEAVEVRPGQAPGEKFKWLGRERDFSVWNRGRQKEFLGDPASALSAVEKRLIFFENKIDELFPLYEAEYAKLKEQLAIFEKMKSEVKDTKILKSYRDENISSLQQNSFNLILNVRYYALSALSMRRFVVGNMYAEMKTRFINDPDDERFIKFLKIYNRLLDDFEQLVVPHLTEADI